MDHLLKELQAYPFGLPAELGETQQRPLVPPLNTDFSKPLAQRDSFNSRGRLSSQASARSSDSDCDRWPDCRTFPPAIGEAHDNIPKRCYFACLWYDQTRGVWFCEVPDLTQVLGMGRSEPEALQDAHFKLCYTIRVLMECDFSVPPPSPRMMVRRRSGVCPEILYEVAGNRGHFIA